MIFNVPGHIAMIRNGLFWYEGIDKTDYSLKAIKEFNIHRTQFLADRLDISKEVKAGLHPLIAKTQTRRVNRGIYQVGRDYAVQSKRGVKAEPGIRIVMDRIWEEEALEFLAENDKRYPVELYISKEDAWAEGGYTPTKFEGLFRELNFKWDGWSRWVFEFHAVEVKLK